MFPKDALITRNMSLRWEKEKEQGWLAVLPTVFLGNRREAYREDNLDAEVGS